MGIGSSRVGGASMRLSANKDSPFFDREMALVTHVFVDGKFNSLVVEFDSDFNWADVIARDAAGRVIIEGDKAKIERLHGKITYRCHGGPDADHMQAHRT